MSETNGNTARWPMQARGVDSVLRALDDGSRKILLTSPTGTGKTLMMEDLIAAAVGIGGRVVLYTNRRLLLEQTSAYLARMDRNHGVRAAGVPGDAGADVQVSSIQTEGARVLRKGSWDVFDATLVLIDEAHAQTGSTVRQILKRHLDAGASYVGLTGTPLDLGGLYDTLVVAGSVAEGRACGALVPAIHYGPDEPDLRLIKKVLPGQDLTEGQQRRAFGAAGSEKIQRLFGRVVKWLRLLNPSLAPSILFAPGVPESLWFAEQLTAAGITAAHVGGEEIWCGGRSWPASASLRADVLGASREGKIKVLCNRFVLREGIDAPWLAHGILACVFGSLKTYLQAGGRLLRAHPGLERVIIQDHGGAWWRHGSLNAARVWRLGQSSADVFHERADALRAVNDGTVPGGTDGAPVREPVACPECRRILASRVCPCGFEVSFRHRRRPVIMEDGTLVELAGAIFAPRKITRRKDAARLWERYYHRAKNSGMTFRQAEALFAVENNWDWPPRTLPLMPLPSRPVDWSRPVTDVPVANLIPKGD